MKDSLESLAVCGGTPAFSEPVHVGRPNVGSRERFLSRMGEILDRRWFTNHGPFVAEFERRLEELLGVRHCIAMCNATIALEITVRALDLRGEVIVPSFTFVATAHALQWQEITPVFCDVLRDTHLIDPAAAERMITPRTTGIIGVHVWGQACDVDALGALAARHRLKVIYDAAHALGSTRRGAMVGSFGDAEVFSFHATKFVNSFEGGAVATNDDALAERIRLMKNFGFAGYDNVIYLGINGKMTEAAAAMGLTSLEDMPQFLEVNRANHEAYRHGLAGVPGVAVFAYDPAERNNLQYLVAEIDSQSAGLSRDDLLAVLHRERVLVRRYFHPGCHRMAPYRALFPHAGLLLPVTEALTDRVLVFPTGTGVDAETIDTICAIVRTAVGQAPAVTARLRQERQAGG